MTGKSRVVPFILISSGAVLLLSATVPILISIFQLQASLSNLIDPTEVSQFPMPRIMNNLGYASDDLAKPQQWFTSSPPDLKLVESKIKYFALSIPKVSLNQAMVEVNGSDLKNHAIHYPGSALPGEYGNTIVFGHSALPQFYRPGNPLTIFNSLTKVKIGDEINVLFDSISYKYIIRNIKEVDPSQIDVLFQHFDRHELTLVTCVPLGTYWRRLVIIADLGN